MKTYGHFYQITYTFCIKKVDNDIKNVNRLDIYLRFCYNVYILQCFKMIFCDF